MKKRKFLNEVYMKEVNKQMIVTQKSEELNCYITIKKIINTSQKCTKYVNGNKITLVDNDYTILEYTPLDENYNVRAFINNEGKILEYYFDVVSRIEIIGNDIFYDDLYLDVIYNTKEETKSCDFMTLVDENELIEALSKNEITTKEFSLAYVVADQIMDELKTNTNRFVNRGVTDYLNYKKKK